MKSLIIMMNAMKHYKHDDLVREEGMQEMLNQDISVPAYRKLIDNIHTKHFRFINRK